MIVEDRAREAARLASLASYRLDGACDPAVDHVVSLAARLTGLPMAGLSVVDADRQWFASHHGMGQHDIPRELAFCDHVVRSGEAVVVPDMRADARFATSAFVTDGHVRSYAGTPVTGRDGLPLGALCVMGLEPHAFTDTDVAELARLGTLVSELLDLRRADAQAGLAAVDVLADSHRLRRAIDRSELVVHYQPVMDLVSGRLVGVEALVRWEHPHRGLLPPSQFLPLAERSGLVVAVDRYVLARAAAQVARWRREVPGAGALHLSVNLSGRQLADPGTVDAVDGLLRGAGLPASALTVELTETSLVDHDPAASVLGAVRDLGCRVSLDDFGTGFSSLAYLQRFAVDEVKLDRCFVSGLGDVPGEPASRCRTDVATSSTPHPSRLGGGVVDAGLRGGAIAAAAVALAGELGCHVVAEGVERRDQVRALQALGCRYAQGFLFSSPRPAAELDRHLRRG